MAVRVRGSATWASPFTPDDLGVHTIANYIDGKKCFFKVDKRKINDSIFILIDELDETNPPYRIENNSQWFSLKYWQKDHKIEDDVEVCETNHCEPFAWADTNA